MSYNHYLDTTNHRIMVARKMLLFCEQYVQFNNALTSGAHDAQHVTQVVNALMARASAHDLSKFSEDEATLFQERIPAIDAAQKQFGYESPEHKSARANLGEALKHHYANNTHHPEHFSNGVEGMNVYDVVEMLCDWWAVADAKVANVLSFIAQNQVRFNISEQLKEILVSTIHYIHNPHELSKKSYANDFTYPNLFRLIGDMIWIDIWSFAESTPKEAYMVEEYNEQVRKILCNKCHE